MQEHSETFDQFWVHYVHAHRNPINRACHYVGTSVAIGSAATAVITLNPAWLLLAPLGYAPAWVGHFVFEKNKPATFQHPLWSLRGDFKMYGLALRGKMSEEIERLCRGDLSPERTHADHVASESHADNTAQNGSATASA